jgi:hypothetical protein
VGLRDKSGLVGHDLFTRDVDKWFDQHFIPAMKKAGVKLDDPAEVAAFNSKFFSNRTAADVAGNLVSGQAQRIKRREQQEKATGMSGAEQLHTKDVGVALEAVNTQLTNMASSAKLAEAAIAGLNGTMGLIQQAGEKLNEPGGWFDRGKKQLESEVRDAKAIGAAVEKVLDWDKSVTAAGRGWLDSGPGATRLGTRKPFEAPASWPTSAAAVPWLSTGEPNTKYAPATTSWSDYFNPGSTRLGSRKSFSPPSFPGPGVSDTTLHGTGIKGPLSVNVAGSVSGEAKLNVNVNPSPWLIAVIERAQAIQLQGSLGNGVGSTGKSSPDAAAPATPSHPSGGHH